MFDVHAINCYCYYCYLHYFYHFPCFVFNWRINLSFLNTVCYMNSRITYLFTNYGNYLTAQIVNS